MTKFIKGQSYTGRSVCDSECIIHVSVAKRTEKTITTGTGKVLRVKVGIDGAEYVKPWGSYSMAPIVRADSIASGRA